MGQGFEWLSKPKPDYSSRDIFSRETKHTKNQFSNFFSFWEKFFSYIKNDIIHHHHTQKAAHHLRKHHKKYIFGSAIGFLFIKVLVTLLTSVGGGTFAQESQNQYYIGDGIVSSYEQCDDGNLENLDGCNSAGQIESGASCIGEPSICSSVEIPEKILIQTGTLDLTGDLIQTGDLELTGIFADTGILDITGNLIETGILDQTLALESTGTLDTTGIIQTVQEEIIEIQPAQEPIITIETGNLESTGEVLEKEFRLSDLDDIDLLNYFYGSGTDFTNTRSSNKCSLEDITIVRLEPGYNTLPNFLNGNTLYLLSSGSYDTRYMINIENDCTAIIGLESGVVLHTTVNKGANIKIASGSNNIIYNITLNGSVSSTGLVHSGNNYGIFVSTPDNSISNIASYDTIGFGVYMENFENYINNISRYDSSLSGQLDNAINTPIILPSAFTGDELSVLLSTNGYIFSGDIWQGIRPFNLFFNSTFPFKTDIYSIDYKIRIRIASGTKLVNASGENFTGIFLSPKTISTSTLKNYFSGVDIISAFKIGADEFVQTQDIDNNPRDFSVSVLLDNFTGTDNLQLYHSIDGDTWTSISSLNISDIDSGINLKFLYDKLGQFVIVGENLIQTGILESTGISILTTGSLIDTGIQDLLSGLNQIGIQTSGENLIQTGTLIQTGIVDQQTGKNLKGTIGEKIDKGIAGGSKQGKGTLSGDILSGGVLSGQQDNLDTMEKKPTIPSNDKAIIFKEKLKTRGYQENLNGKMHGKNSIDFTDVGNEILVPVIVESITGIIDPNPIQVEFTSGIIIKTVSGSDYTGVLDTPIFTDESQINIPNQEIISAIKVGPDTPGLIFKDINGNDVYATIRVPVSGVNIGDTVIVNYSSDGVTINRLTDTVITSIDGQAFAIFHTNHFTQFYLGVNLGNFRIANDAIYITGYSTTLNTTLAGATQMRFGNMPSTRDSTGWLTYATSYPWTLLSGDGIRGVYATFSGGGISSNVKDEIIVDTTAPPPASNYVIYVPGSGVGTTFSNLADATNNFTSVAVTTGKIGSQTYMIFNGTTSYLQDSTWIVASYPFTMMARVKPSRVLGTQVLFGENRTNKTNIYYSAAMSGNRFGMICANGGAEVNNRGTTIANTGTRYYVSLVFVSDTLRKLYVNGKLEVTGTGLCAYAQNGNNRQSIGRMSDGTPDRYFSGYIDEMRFYSEDLSANMSALDFLYMGKVTAKNLTTFDTTPTVYGTIFSTTDTFSVQISGTNNPYKQTFPATNDLQKKWTLYSSGITPVLTTGRYDLNLIQSNEYTATRTTKYTGALVINPVSVIYNPSTYTTGNVIATLTGLYETDIITNNNGNTTYLFTNTGNFTFEYIDDNGNTGSTTATVTWIDRQAPVISTGYVSSGTTGTNGGNLYYKGLVNIRADILDVGAGLSGATCQYTTGSSRFPATFYASYCEKTGVNSSDLNIRFRIQDTLRNQGTGGTGTYIYDNTAPPLGSFVINGDVAGTSTTGVTLNITCPTDAGVGGTQVAYGTGASPSNWSSCTATKSQTLDIGDGTKTVYMRFRDSFANTTTDTTDTILLDTTGPTVSTGYIAAGTTGTNGNTGYYKGTINIRANISDGAGIGLNSVTCEYTLTGTSRVAAIYQTTYCEGVGLTPAENLNIRFRVRDTLGNQGTGNIGSYNYDAAPPSGGSFTINNDAAYTSFTGVTLNIACPTDVGIGGIEIAYGNTSTPTNRTGCAATKAYAFSTPTDGTKTVYMRFRDRFLNTTTSSTDTILLDKTGPSVPSLISPYSGFSSTTGNLNFLRGTSVDLGLGLSGYIYQISTDNFASIYKSGFTSNTGINITGISDNNYYWRIYAVDNLGQTGGLSSGWLFSIDSIPPTASVYYSTTGDTNQDVIATLTGRIETLTGINATGYTFTGNGNFKFTFSDLAGNTGEVTATVDRIDKIKPTASVLYSITGSTTFPVDAILTGYSETLTGINSTGYNFLSNGNFTFTFSDLAGNTGSVLAAVDRIYIPSITGINLDPALSASYFSNYNLLSTISGSITSASVDLKGINADGGNCTHYSASGVCVSTTFNYPLGFSGNQIWLASGIRPDQLYPQITFAPSDITRNNTPDTTMMTTDSYTIMHLQNKFSMTGDTSFWIETNVMQSSSNSVNLSVYLVEKGHDITYFNDDWLSKTGVEMVGMISRDEIFDHQHTLNSQHHLIALSTNSDGTIGNNNINISGDFWIVLYPNTTDTDRGWNLRYQPSSLCENTSGRYQGDKGAGRSTTYQSGCPDTHVHMAKRGIDADGVNAVVTATYNSGANSISGSNNFFFAEISNMPPNPALFILPTSDRIYTGDINIQRNPSLDPNNDVLTHNVYLLDSTGNLLQTLFTGIYIDQYTLAKGIISDGEYDLKLETCDEGGLCSVSYLDDNFFVDITTPTAIVIYSTTGLTKQDVIVTLTGYSETLVSINATGYTFTGNGSFTFTFSDLAGNIGSTIATVTGIDKSAPILSTGYVSSGTTGSNGANLYYKGLVNIRSDMSDNLAGLSGATCEYNKGLGRLPAIYSGTSLSGYCEATGINGSDLYLRFRIQDSVGNIGIGSTGTYLYDNLAPSGGSFVINNNSGYTTTTGVTLNITCPSDAGVGGVQIAYGTGSGPTNRTSCSSTKSWTFDTGYGTKTIYARFRDAFNNIASDITDTIILDVNKPLVYYTGLSLNYPINATIYANNFFAEVGLIEEGAGLKTFYVYRNQFLPVYDASSLVYMNMNNISSLGESETLIKDLGRYGNHGEGVSLVYTGDGDFGGGYEFDGNTAYIQINGNTGVSLPAAHAISVSVYPYDNIGLHVVAGNTTGSFLLGFDENNLYYQTSPSSSVSVPYNISLDTWTSLTVSRTGTSVSFYADGAQIGTTQTLTSNDSMTLHYIGKESVGDTNNLFVGKIDEYRTFARDLSALEVGERYGVNFEKVDATNWILYSAKNNLVDGVTYTYYGYAVDNAGNTSTSAIRTVRHVTEEQPPTVPNPITPLSGDMFITGTIDFQRTTSIDTGVGMHGYEREIASDYDFIDIIYSGFVNDPETGFNFTGLQDGVYYRHVNSQDIQDNDSAFSTGQMFIVDTSGPILSTGYISDGLTGTDGSNLYYKGLVNIRSDIIYELVGSSGSTCQYSTGGARLPAIYSGAGLYCEVTGLDFQSDFDVVFRLQDILGNLGTSSTGIYLYDATPPEGGMFNINNNATGTNLTGVTLNITCPTDDGGVGYVHIANGPNEDPDVRVLCESTLPYTLSTGDGIKTVYVRFRDAFSNITTNITDTIILDTTGPTPPTLLLPTDNYAQNTGKVELRWSTGSDEWMGISEYMRQLSTDNFSSIYLSGTTSFTGINISLLPQGSYKRRVYAHDVLGNMGTWSSPFNFKIDFTSPTVTTGYIAVGTTGINNGNIYFNSAIQGRANVYDVLAGLNTGSCESSSGVSWMPAFYSGNTTSGYCYQNGTPMGNINLRFRIVDAAGNIGIGSTGTFLYDATAPINGSFVINNDADETNQTGITLNITCPTDAGVSGIQIAYGNSPSPTNRTGCSTSKSREISTGDGVKTVYMRFRDALQNISIDTTDTIFYDTSPPAAPELILPFNGSAYNTGTINLLWSGAADPSEPDTIVWDYIREISTGSEFSNIYLSGESMTTGLTISGLLAGNYYRRIRGIDHIGNIGIRSSGRNFKIDFTSPTVSTGYIAVGSTGNNGSTLYFKGTIEPRATVNDALAGLNTGSCYSSSGGSWMPASYSGNATSGYCYQNGTPIGDINLRFRVLDAAGNTGVGNTGTYIYDATTPSGLSFTINNDVAGTNTTGVTLNITCPTDTGVSGIQIAFGNTSSPSNRQTCAASKSYTLTSLESTNTVYMRTRDALQNTTIDISDTIILDQTPPTIGVPEMFTGNYTGLYFNGEVSVRSSISDSLSLIKSGSCEVDVGGGWTTEFVSQDSNYCYYTGVNHGADFDIQFRIQDNASNYGTSSTTSFIHDDTPPSGGSFKINSDATYTNSTGVILNITCPTDIGGVGYVQVSNGPDIDPENRISCESSLPYILSTGDGGKVIYMRFRDALNNTTTNITDIIILDQTSPSLGVPTIFTGNYNGPYFNGTVGLRSIISDTLSNPKSASCEVDIGGGWTSVGVNQDTNYCYYTGYNPQSNITIKFRLQDNALNYGTSSTSNYTYDASSPTVSTGYISVGTTGVNGNTGYYKGTINIRSDILDAGVGLSGATCQYTTGGLRNAAIYNTTYCEATNLSPATDINIRFRIQDVLGNQGTGGIGTYIYDTTPPPSGSFVINSDDASTNTRFVTLNISCPTDAGVGGVQVAYGNSSSPSNRTGCTATKQHTLLVGNGDKTVYMRFRDTFTNTTVSDVTDTITLNIIPPTVSIGFVSSGLSAINGNTGYYKGIIDIRADVTDEGRGLNGSTCQYTTGLSRASAVFNFTYCEVTGLDYTSLLNVQFRIQDDDGTMGTGGIGIYAYDNISPTQATMTAEPTYTQGTTNTVSSTTSTDTGANNVQYEFCINTGDTTIGCTSAGWSGTNTVTFTGLSGGQIYYYFVRSQDGVSNTTSRSSSTSSTQDNISPTYTWNTPSSGNRYTSGSTILVDVSVTETGAGITNDVTCNPKIDGGISSFTSTVTYSGTVQKCLGTLTFNNVLSDGPHNLTIQVADTVSNSGQSSPVTVNFDNTLPSSIVLSITNFTHNTRGTYIGVVTGTIVGTRGPSAITVEYNTGGSWINIGTATGFSFTPLEGTTNVQMRVTDLGGGPISSNTFTIKKDTTSPTVGVASVYSGTTGNNGATLYYKGIIDIRANVSDGGASISGSTCQYTTGSSRAAATYSGNGGFCFVTGLNFTNNITINFRVKDITNNLGTGTSTTYNYDITGPSIPQLLSPTSGQNLNTGDVELRRSGSIDAGIGLSGYVRQVSTGPAFTDIYLSGSTLNTGININGLFNATYYRRVYALDILNNTGGFSSGWNFIINVDINSPTVGAAEIFVGTTGNNGSTGYYKGTIDIRATVSDVGGIDGATCEYTTGAGRATATYDGSTYCYISGLDPQSDITINFRVKDLANNLGTGTSSTYIYDISSPINGTFTINSGSLFSNTTGVNLNVSCPVDTGISNIQIAYGNSTNPDNWTTCTDTVGHYLTSGDGQKTVYILFRDGLGNTTNEITQTITLDTITPTIIFTGSTPGNGSTLNSNNFTTQLEISDPDLNGIGNFQYIYDGTTYNIYDTGLLLMYNFDNISSLGENANTVKDTSQYQNHSSVVGASPTTSGVWNGAYNFDGTNQYMLINDGAGLSLGTTHTISVWINPRSSTGVVLGSYANSHGLYISGSQIIYSPSDTTSVSFDSSISLNSRTQLTILRNGTSVDLYKNGSFISNSSLSLNDPLELFYIGKENNNGVNEKRFNGRIDELYIYNRVLSTGDISQFSRSSLSKYDTGKWLYTIDYSCVITGGDYIYSGLISDRASNPSSTTRSSTINLPNPISNIQATSIDMGGIQASMESSQTLSGQSVGNFSVSDWRGNAPWYTTITTPLNLIGDNNNFHAIAGSQIYFKSSGISTVSGFSTNLIYVVGNLSGYVNAPNAATYIRRDSSDIPFMCPGGVYGNRPSFKVEIPAGQAIDTYSGTITYDIIY